MQSSAFSQGKATSSCPAGRSLFSGSQRPFVYYGSRLGGNMHCICVIGTFFLLILPYVLSQALGGLRSPNSGKLLNCTFAPHYDHGIEGLHEEATRNITVECSCSLDAARNGKNLTLQVRSDKGGIVDVLEGHRQTIDCANSNASETSTSSNLVVIVGKFLGREALIFTVREESEEKKAEDSEQLLQSYPVTVVRKPSWMDTAFIAIIGILVGINTINMGCHLDLGVVADNLKKPCAIGIGFTSQYVFMPLVAYGIALALLTEPNLQLGLFTMGCSPGGGASNFWTLLLEGDAHLSVTMTFLSTALALVMMPFWLFTLGSTLFGSLQIRIPWVNILSSLISLVGPLAIGVLIRRYRPRTADFALKLIRPFAVAMFLFIFTCGIYTNLYMFSVMNWRTMLCGLIVPWCGYIFGAALAIISRRSKEQVIAISVETGVQNTGVAIMLLRLSLQQPDADLASVLPVCGSMMLFIPLFLWYVGLLIRNKCCSPQKDMMSVSTEEGSLEKVQPDGSMLSDDDHHPYKGGELKIYTGMEKEQNVLLKTRPQT